MKSSCVILASVLAATVACESKDRVAAAASAAVSTTQTPAPAAVRLTAADLQDRMQKIGSAAASAQMHLMEKRLMDTAKEAQDVATLLGDVEKFWAQNNRPDAVAWAQQARQAATQLAGTAAAGDAMKAQMAAGSLMGNCQMCHDAYREPDGKGGFRLKAGTIR
jgi:hypothetical protein